MSLLLSLALCAAQLAAPSAPPSRHTTPVATPDSVAEIVYYELVEQEDNTVLDNYLFIWDRREKTETPKGYKPFLYGSLSLTGYSILNHSNSPSFWILNKQYGMVPYKENPGFYRLKLNHAPDEQKRFDWGVGIDASLAQYNIPAPEGSNKDFDIHDYGLLQQIYAEARYRSLDLMVGMKQMPGWISDPELASGNLLYGNNSKPIPQVRAGIFDYTGFWGCENWLAIKGYLAYGFFTDNNWIKGWVNPEPVNENGQKIPSHYALNTLYNSKGFMWRIGNPDRHRLDFEWGLDIATQFGGDLYKNGELYLKMPRGLKSWIHAIFPMGADSSAPTEDQVNFEGNSLGTWNMALNWRPNADINLKLYYQHFFEDHSMLTFDYTWKDGLWGIQTTLPPNPIASDIVCEFIYTKDQSGAVYWDHDSEIPTQVSALDNYYNHGFYNGWQNYGMTIGNPLLLSPIYNDDHQLVFKSNRIIAYHLGMRGKPIKQVDYRLLTTWQRSWGTYLNPFPEVKKQFSMLLEVGYTLNFFPFMTFNLGYGFDKGSLIGNNHTLCIGFEMALHTFKRR